MHKAGGKVKKCDTMEANMMEYHPLPHKLAKFGFAEDFAIFKIKLSFFANIQLQMQLKTVRNSVHGVCHSVIFLCDIT